MSLSVLIDPLTSFWNDAGSALASTIEVYDAGGAQLSTIYTTNAGDIEANNPLPLVGGRATIFAKDGTGYKVILKSNTGDALKTLDNLYTIQSYIRYFDTVADMVADKTLSVGMIVETAGYYSKGDGGDNRYEIVDAATGTHNGGTYIDLAGSGLQAKGLFPSGIYNDKQWGAKADGITDDRTSLFNADAFGSFTLKSGAHKISSNITFTNVIAFESDAKLSIDAGKVVTFNKNIESSEQQIFIGSGTVTGLDYVNIVWFADINTATDTTSLIQKAYDACNNYALVEWPPGFWSIAGTTAISVTKGQKSIGTGPSSTELRFTGTETTGFKLSGLGSASLEGFSFNLITFTSVPTNGICLDIQSARCILKNFIIYSSWIGVEFTSGGDGSKLSDYEILDTYNIGINCKNVIDIYGTRFIISATGEHFVMSGVSGTFVVGETVTGGTSGATGTILSIINSTTYKIHPATINFTVTETLTGGTSLATGTLVSQTIPHALGGIRLSEKTEAISFSQGDIIGGSYPLTTDAAAYGVGTRPAYCKFTEIYFDSADNGVLLNNIVDTQFNTCWFSNRPNDGCNLQTSESVSFVNCDFVNSYNRGLFIETGAIGCRVIGCTVSGNNASSTSKDGIELDANVNDFIIQGNRLGGTLGLGTQRYGINVNIGTSDRYIIADNLVSGNATGGVTDGGTGSNKRVTDNY